MFVSARRERERPSRPRPYDTYYRPTNLEGTGVTGGGRDTSVIRDRVTVTGSDIYAPRQMSIYQLCQFVAQPLCVIESGGGGRYKHTELIAELCLFLSSLATVLLFKNIPTCDSATCTVRFLDRRLDDKWNTWPWKTCHCGEDNHGKEGPHPWMDLT